MNCPLYEATIKTSLDMGKISVIVPCYNIEDYIELTVRSILAQTYENLEVILVDDGSTDQTAEIIDRLSKQESRVSAFHKRNGGVSSARLQGIDRASGEWITFADGDELLKPEMYSTLISNAHKYNAEISHCGYEMVFPDHTDPYYGTDETVLQDNRHGLIDLLSGTFIEPGLWNKIYRRKIILEAREDCRRTTGISNLEDLLWNYYFFKRAKRAVFVDHCYYQHVLRKDSASTTHNINKVLDPLRVFRIIEKDIANRDMDDSNELVRIVRSRIVSCQINLITSDIEEEPDRVHIYTQRAKDFLQKNSMYYFFGPYSLRLKTRVILASFSPEAYKQIHTIYQKLRGTYHKYEI